MNENFQKPGSDNALSFAPSRYSSQNYRAPVKQIKKKTESSTNVLLHRHVAEGSAPCKKTVVSPLPVFCKTNSGRYRHKATRLAWPVVFYTRRSYPRWFDITAASVLCSIRACLGRSPLTRSRFMHVSFSPCQDSRRLVDTSTARYEFSVLFVFKSQVHIKSFDIRTFSRKGIAKLKSYSKCRTGVHA